MAPTRKSRSLNKRFSYTNEVSPIRHGESADRRIQRKRKLSDMLGPQWSKEELERFYEAYRKHGKDWKKVGAVMRNRSIEMVEALYTMNRAYLSLPEGTASVAGLIAMMTDHYCNLAGSDSEQESNDGAGTSRKPQKRSQGKVQPKTSKGSDGHLSLHSQAVASSYDCQPLLKKKRSGGSRPRVVGKRTPRFPVSYSFENVNGEKYFSPTRQGPEFKFDANDDEVAHEMLIVLAEASQRGGSSQLFRTPKRMVGGSDMDEDGLEGRMEPDNGDISRDKSYLMKTGSIGALSQKGRRLYGKKLEADSTKDNHLDEIREACSGTEEGQIVGVDRGKSYSEVTDANIARSSSQGLRKRSKKVLFRRDEGSAFNALQTLADLSLRMPESTNDNDSFVQIKEESNEVDKSKSLEAMPANHQKEKRRLSGFKIKGNHLISGSERVIDKASQPGRVSVHDVSPSPEAKQETHQSTITKVSRIKQKTMTSKISKAEAQSDAHMNESQEAEARDVGKKSTSKGKRASQSASPNLVKHPENSSSKTDPRKEGGDSAVLTIDVPITDQVDIITKVRSRRKMKLQKPQIFADSKLLDKTEKLSNCFSNHRARRWCAFEWFYSAIDYPWFAKREFVEYLFHVGLGHVPRLTRVEWGVIRSSLGKPRRYSEQFLKEEKEKLNQYRDSVRTYYTELRSGTREGLPTDLARPLSVGQRVIAIHPKTREIHDGSVLTVDHNRCRVQFDIPELGVEFVMDIDCMPLNPLENMATSLARHTIAVDKFLENFNKLKMNGHTKNQRPEGYIKFSPGEILENFDAESLMTLSAYPMHNLLKQEKVAFATADSQANIDSEKIATNQQTACSQPCSVEQSQAKEADVQALAELTRALDKKQVLVSELREMNNDVLENQKDGDFALKDAEPFKKQYAAILIQLREVDERVSSALYCLRQRNTYQGNLSLTWPRSMTDIGDSVGVLSSFNYSKIHTEESGSHVNDIVESSRTRARTMVDSAIQAYSSMMGGGNTFEKIEETIDYVNDQLVQPPLDDSYIPAGRFFTAADCGNLVSQEQFKCRTVSPLQALPSPKLKNPSSVPSELVTKCVATLLMIQKCTERQFPPADVAQILDSAVTSLQPCSSQNLPVYADIEKCMVMIRNQILALIPT